jgi:hypothetical protein
VTAAVRTVGEPYGYINIMEGSPPGASRWDDAGRAEGAIRTLDDLLTKAGLPGRMTLALRLLGRTEELVAASRVKRDAAQAKLEAAHRSLLADGEIDLDGYADVLRECAVWIDENGPASIGVGDAARSIRVRAVMTVFGQVSGLYRQLRDRAIDIVAVIGGIPELPREIWSVQKYGEASTLMIRANREADWAQLVRMSDAWDNVHAAGRLLRKPVNSKANSSSTGRRLILASCI